MWTILIGVAFLFMASPASAQQKSWPDGWRDPHPHKARYVEVEKGVSLEVLDWGGSGRPLILLAGLGRTAHNFDDFAPRLKRDFRVYAVTRRGYGYSTLTEGGYDADRLGDDVVAVLDALKLRQKPVLVGHSIGGQELSSVASRYPDRVAGVVYIDGAYEYAMAIPEDDALYGVAEWKQAVVGLQEKLSALEAEPSASLPLMKELLTTQLPRLQRDLEEAVLARSIPETPPAPPRAEDFASWKAAMAWAERNLPYDAPESDWRIAFSTPEGLPRMEHRTPKRVPDAINAGERQFASIPVPALSLYRSLAPVTEADPKLRAAMEARYRISEMRLERLSKIFLATAPKGRVVFVPGANHYIHRSHPDVVERELRAFIATLPN